MSVRPALPPAALAAQQLRALGITPNSANVLAYMNLALRESLTPENIQAISRQIIASGGTITIESLQQGITASLSNTPTAITRLQDQQQQLTAAGATFNPNNVAVLAQAQTLQVSNGGTYTTPDGSNIRLTPGMAVPANWTPVSAVIQTTGTVWTVPSGGVAFALPGSQIPANWTPNRTIAYDESKAFLVGDYVQTAGQDGWYTNPSTGEIKVIPKGQAIPYGWRTATTDQIPTDSTQKAVSAAPGTWRKINAGGDPLDQIESPSIVKAVAIILGIGGIAIVGYVGYLWLYSPTGLNHFIAKFSQIKDLVLDSATIAAAFAVIAALSFVSYEFFINYEKTGTIIGALAGMLTSTIEVFIEALVETVETIAKDAWLWISSEFTILWNESKP